MITKQERGNVCRSLYDLLNGVCPQIKVCFIAQCKITKRKVKHYSTIDWKPQQQLKLYE